VTKVQIPMRALPLTTILVVSGALTSCSMDSGFSRRTYIDLFRQETRDEVDILWIVDNSESMEAEQERLARRFDTFIEYMDEVETLMDFHLGVITTDMSAENPDRARLLGDPPVLTRLTPDYVDKFKERVQVGIEGSGMEQGLEASLVALSEPMVSDANYGFMRSGAMLVLIYVSDENDCSDRGALPSEDYCYLDAYQDDLVAVSDYVSDFRSIKSDPELVLSFSIVGPVDTTHCDDTLPGFRYHDMANLTGGSVGSICSEDFAGIMDDLGLSVSGIRSAFPLTYRPVENTIEVWVCPDEPCDGTTGRDIARGEADGWSYDDSTAYLTFNGASVPERGAVISVKYEVAGNVDRTDTGDSQLQSPD
jgi:hypothetical protein